MNRFLEFWMIFFQTYDITTEVAVGLFIFAALLIVWASKPADNYMFKHFLAGMGLSIGLIVLHIILLGQTLIMRRTNDPTIFNIVYVIYSIAYVGILNEIFSYITNLSYKRRFQHRQQFYMTTVFGSVWLFLMLYPLVTGQLLSYENGIYTLTSQSNVYVWCSFSDALLALCSVFANRKDLPRVVLWGTSVFIPVDMLAIISQIYFPTSYFICATYCLPYMLFFILFHANTYDYVTGCQGMEAERTYIDSLIKKKKKFFHLAIQMPKLETRNIADFEEIWTYSINYVARAIEKLHFGIRVYRISPFAYNVVCAVRDANEFERVKSVLTTLVGVPIPRGEISYKTQVNSLITSDYGCITDAGDYLAFIYSKLNSFEDLDTNQVVVITEEDAIKYKQADVIIKNLLEIRNNGKLDDERIEVYVQPIFDIDSKEFRTGESLMRMTIDGKRIFPDQFIPLAESTGCIHSLTKIMLHKVSKIVAEMEKVYDFDGLTINVSTMELTDSNAADEFLNIIKDAGASMNKIRLEITESTTISNYSVILENMKKLGSEGIRFYLDDFGTGYSNLERMSSMPFSTIKIDKSLLYRALADKRSDELLHTLAGFFKKSGFSMVVEGVEDEKQKEYVEEAGIDYIQGYYYSKPIPALEAIEFFKKK